MAVHEQHTPNDGGATPTSTPSGTNVPALVYAGAAIMPIIALGLAIILGLLAAIIGREVSAFGIGPAIASTLLGQAVQGAVGVRFLTDASASIALVPFGVILPAAFLLHRTGFTSAWLRVRHARLLPAAAGGVAALVVGFLLSILGEGSAGSMALYLEFTSEPRPLWALVSGAAPWLLAVLIANSPIARRILRGLLLLEALLVIGVVLLTGYAGFEEGVGLGPTLVAMLGMLIVTMALSVNVIAALLVLPLGGALGARIGDSSVSVGFYEVFFEAPDTPAFWFLILISVGSLILFGWRAGTPTDLRDAVIRTRTFLIAASATILPILLLGRLYGDFGADIVGDLIGVGFGRAFEASAGSSGQPLRWILIAASAGIIHLATGVVLARRAGLSWASDQNLSAAGQGVVTGTSSRFKGAAERARQAAEAARAAAQSAAAPPPATPEAGTPDDTHGPR